MIRYLLDTDIASYVMKARYPALDARVSSLAASEWAISAITQAEILIGLEPLPRSHPMRPRAAEFLRRAKSLPWPVEAAFPYAEVGHRIRNQPIGERDLLIAAHAIALDATLVTNNMRHFSRIGAPLRCENWME